MTAPLAPEPRPKILSIMPTYRCTAACRNCGTFSSPALGHASLERDTVIRVIAEAGASGYRGVVFTGGEATLALDIVLEGVAKAKALRMGTRLVTNGWWADSDAAADDILRRLRSAGLDELNLSTGDQHARFVPVSSVVRAVAKSIALGFRSLCVMVEVTDTSSIRKEHILEDQDFQRALAHGTAHVQVFESPWMPIHFGRQHSYPEGYLLNRNNLALKTGCTSCLTTTTVQADGRIAACCGIGVRTIPELQVGCVETTSLREADQAAADDFLKRWIRLDGPEKILAWAAEIDPEIDWENKYAHKCQACIRLYKDERVRSVIQACHQEKFADVLLGEFLLTRFEAPALSTFPEESPRF
jgi:MoaA/NifB/PqqE/SkfB family radical SAM enzyme